MKQRHNAPVIGIVLIGHGDEIFARKYLFTDMFLMNQG